MDPGTIVAVAAVAGTTAITITAMVLMRPRKPPHVPTMGEQRARNEAVKRGAVAGPTATGEKTFGSAPDLPAAPEHGRRIPRPIPPVRRQTGRGSMHRGQWTSGPMGGDWSGDSGSDSGGGSGD